MLGVEVLPVCTVDDDAMDDIRFFSPLLEERVLQSGAAVVELIVVVPLANANIKHYFLFDRAFSLYTKQRILSHQA